MLSDTVGFEEWRAYAGIRGIAVALLARAHWSMGERRWDQARKDLAAVIRIGLRLRDDPDFIALNLSGLLLSAALDHLAVIVAERGR